MILFMVFWNGSYPTFWRLKLTHLNLKPTMYEMAMYKIKLKICVALHLYKEMIREVCKDFIQVWA